MPTLQEPTAIYGNKNSKGYQALLAEITKLNLEVKNPTKNHQPSQNTASLFTPPNSTQTSPETTAKEAKPTYDKRKAFAVTC